MQTAVSPSKHPGIFSHIDRLVTMYDAPPSHRGPLLVGAASGEVIKADHIKLAFLADGIFEFTRRKCTELGENLTNEQIRDLEAQVLEFYGKQKVGAAKILDEAGIIPGRGR
jgi:hypothetical protein